MGAGRGRPGARVRGTALTAPLYDAILGTWFRGTVRLGCGVGGSRRFCRGGRPPPVSRASSSWCVGRRPSDRVPGVRRPAARRGGHHRLGRSWPSPCHSDRRLRASTVCRPSDWRGGRGSCGVAGNGRRRSARRRLRARPRARQPARRPCRCCRAVDWRVLLRSRCRGAGGLCGWRILRGPAAAMVSRRSSTDRPKPVDGRFAEHAARGSLVLRWLGGHSASTRRGWHSHRADSFGRAVHGESSGRAVLVSTEGEIRRTDCGGDSFGTISRSGLTLHERVAPSIAVFARRSACAFSERPTCSNVTRPISWASSRAFACSGCSPAFFTL